MRMVEHSGLVDKTVGPTKHPISHPVPIKAQPGDLSCGSTVDVKWIARLACGGTSWAAGEFVRRNCRAGDVGPRWLDDRRPEGPRDLPGQGPVSGPGPCLAGTLEYDGQECEDPICSHSLP